MNGRLYQLLGNETIEVTPAEESPAIFVNREGLPKMVCNPPDGWLRSNTCGASAPDLQDRHRRITADPSWRANLPRGVVSNDEANEIAAEKSGHGYWSGVTIIRCGGKPVAQHLENAECIGLQTCSQNLGRSEN